MLWCFALFFLNLCGILGDLHGLRLPIFQSHLLQSEGSCIRRGSPFLGTVRVRGWCLYGPHGWPSCGSHVSEYSVFEIGIGTSELSHRGIPKRSSIVYNIRGSCLSIVLGCFLQCISQYNGLSLLESFWSFVLV